MPATSPQRLLPPPFGQAPNHTPYTTRLPHPATHPGHGTKLDDVWIKPQTARQLRPGAILQFGASTRKYRVVSVAQQQQQPKPRPDAPPSSSK